MKREVTLEEISDGKLYGLNDMVKADCFDCKGCSSCCQNMGESIVLTPYDVYLLTQNLNCSFESLLDKHIELNVVDGIILPNLKMQKENGNCSFLNEQGRCDIHPFRPSICRLFPLGRIYEENGFRYFLQTNECKNKNRGKIKVSKWIDTPQTKEHEAFILRWHTLLKNFEKLLKENTDYEQTKKYNMLLLSLFYSAPYEKSDFYAQIEQRFKKFGC